MPAPKAPGPDTDSLTYLPVDRSAAAQKIYAPTHPRHAPPQGGMRLGNESVFVLDENMARLEVNAIAAACDSIVQGKNTYGSLLYLSRARLEDIPALLQASQDEDVKVRWERLWVLTPFLARLSRFAAASQAILQALEDDLAGIHLLSKFIEQDNPAIKKMFNRMHDALLKFLLRCLLQHQDDPRRGALIAGIIATLEQQAEVLRQLMPADVHPAAAEEVLGFLYTRPHEGSSTRLSPAFLRSKLESWRR